MAVPLFYACSLKVGFLPKVSFHPHSCDLSQPHGFFLYHIPRAPGSLPASQTLPGWRTSSAAFQTAVLESHNHHTPTLAHHLHLLTHQPSPWSQRPLLTQAFKQEPVAHCLWSFLPHLESSFCDSDPKLLLLLFSTSFSFMDSRTIPAGGNASAKKS